MSIKEIIEKYLKENGYDGLCNPDISCGCGLKDGLFPCELDLCDVNDCVVAISKIATEEDIDDESDFEIGDEIFILPEDRKA